MSLAGAWLMAKETDITSSLDSLPLLSHFGVVGVEGGRSVVLSTVRRSLRQF